MKVNLEKTEKNTVVLEIEVDKERVNQAFNEAFRKLAKEVNVPGFRKGKTPRKILEKYISPEIVSNEVADILMPEAYIQALDENELEPIDRPKADIVSLKEDEPFVFKVTVDVKPEIKLSEYTGLGIEKKKVEVTPEDEEKTLKRMQDQAAKLNPSDAQELKEGHYAFIDFEGFLDGVSVDNAKGEDFALEIGSKTFVPGFEEQLVGMKLGEEKTLNVTFPEDYHGKELAGKDVEFKVSLKEIKEKTVPELNDDFAKEVSDFDTIDELKKSISDRLLAKAQETAETEISNIVLDKIAEGSEVEVPEVLVDGEIDNILHSLKHRLQHQGITFEQYLEYLKKDEETHRQEYKELAEKRVKTQLVVDEIAKKEQIKPADEDIQREIIKMAYYQGKKPEKFVQEIQQNGMLENIVRDITREKAIKFLVDANTLEADGGKADVAEDENAKK